MCVIKIKRWAHYWLIFSENCLHKEIATVLIKRMYQFIGMLVIKAACFWNIETNISNIDIIDGKTYIYI